MKNRKIINITHTDLDGVGCSVVLNALFPGFDIESHYCGYHDVELRISEVLNNLTDDVFAIYITDISFREESRLAEVIEKINHVRGSNFIRLIDHHATSGYLNKYSWAFSQENDESTGELKCGTQWLYEKIIGERISSAINVMNHNTLDRFVELVNLWDTWRWVTDFSQDNPCERARWLNMVFSIKGKKKFCEDYTKKVKTDSPIFSETEYELIICKQQEIENDIIKKNKELVEYSITYATKRRHLKFIKDYLESNHIEDKSYLLDTDYKKSFRVGVVFLDKNTSDIGNRLAQMNSDLDFIMCIDLPKTISLRCVKDLEVPLGILANFITGKGGGHPKSAGGVIKSDFGNKVVANLIDSIYD